MSDKNNKDKFINKLVKFILNAVLGLFLYLLVGVEFGYFNTIYCEPTDGESNNNVDSNKDNKSVTENKEVKGKEKKDDDTYKVSANVAKGMIKEAVQGAVEGISKAVPVVVGGMVGGSLGVAVIKASNSLPPVQKAILGVGTAVGGAFTVTAAAGISSELVNKITKNNPTSNNKTSSGDSGIEGLIPSVLETGDELSPLQLILNYEIILGLLILVHMFILFLI